MISFETQSAKLLTIRIFPDPILKVLCEPIIEVNDEIRTLIQNMFATMYHNQGFGLSANQIGISKRIFVMDVSEDRNSRYSFINPEIIEFDNIDRNKEGCLSFPDIFVYVRRPTKIKIKALNEQGEIFELDFQGIEAICFGHELDHLNGKTFMDHLSPVQKNLIKKRIKELKK